MTDPTMCQYAPPGEYMKDHSLIFHDGWWHLYNISGTAGYYHGYNGNEETVAWSVSRDLVAWEFRGHVLHASQWPGFFDQHEVWAPFCFKAPDGFYLFYTGIVHPTRPMEYRRLGHSHPWVYEGHCETQGIARSTDLTDWVKISDAHAGSGVPGRDSHVVRDEANGRWLLYSTLGTVKANVSESQDLEHWQSLGECAEFPPLFSNDPRLGGTARGLGKHLHSSESLTVMRHPVNGRWIMLGNWQYILSDDPEHFAMEDARVYDLWFEGEGSSEKGNSGTGTRQTAGTIQSPNSRRVVDIGYAGEILEHGGKWYRTGVMGERDYWKLGMTEIEWMRDGAFRIVKPSAMAGE